MAASNFLRSALFHSVYPFCTSVIALRCLFAQALCCHWKLIGLHRGKWLWSRRGPGRSAGEAQCKMIFRNPWRKSKTRTVDTLTLMRGACRFQWKFRQRSAASRFWLRVGSAFTVCPSKTTFVSDATFGLWKHRTNFFRDVADEYRWCLLTGTWLMRQVQPTIGGDPASWHTSPSLGRNCLVARGLTGMLLTVCHLPLMFPASPGPRALDPRS